MPLITVGVVLFQETCLFLIYSYIDTDTEFCYAVYFLLWVLDRRVWNLLVLLIGTWLHISGEVHTGAASPGQHIDVLVLLYVSSKFRIATFFHLPLPPPANLSGLLQWPLTAPQLPSQEPLAAVSHIHRQPVDWVLQKLKVPRACSHGSHTFIALRINYRKLLRKTGFFPPMPVPSLTPHTES